MRTQVARDISYAHSARSRAGRVLVRAMENSTGRLRLIRRAEGYERDVAGGKSFWQVMVERYGLELDIVGGSLADIPAKGPLVMVANHPYGILDGMMMGHILSHVRGDFRILANDVFSRADDLTRVVLPISFEQTKEALALNLQTRKTSLDYLAGGGAIGVFPGGTVSTAAQPLGTPLDPSWRAFTARMIDKSDAVVVPVFFDGTTSRLFQIASHVHPNLRVGLLINEFRKRVDGPVRVVIGAPIARSEMPSGVKDGRAMMDFLRQSTYELSPKPLDAARYGYDFEEKHRVRAI